MFKAQTRFAVILLSVSGWAAADVRLPSLISDHMLIQRDAPARIWGKADPGEQVTVTLAGGTRSTTADALGRWEVFLPPAQAGGPFELTVKGKNVLQVDDVLVGDVWIASGQSNMVWQVSRSDNARQEIASARFPRIRLFKAALKTSDYPLDDVEGAWTTCNSETLGAFSAVGYFFARDLHQKYGVPVGIIQSAWGGTPAESWISPTSLAADPALISVYADWAQLISEYPEARARYEIRLKEWEEKNKTSGGTPAPGRPGPPVGPGHPWEPSSLYNAMIAPLTPYAIKGAIWYQGENNAHKSRSYVYRRLFQAMIQDWRRSWGQGNFPFLFVQLANYAKTPAASEWPELREAQTMALALSKTGMAVTIDIGNPNDIHPTNKQDVGRRLALAARHIAFGEEIVYSGPLFREVTEEGKSLRVWFSHLGGGLTAKGGPLRAFEVAGRDKKYVPANAAVEGKTVIVSSESVTEPMYVRYNWADSPDGNLYNAEGLPASPFRSEEWTAPAMYR